MNIIANKYTIIEFLGNGKFGSVYKGVKKNGEMVAIKMESKHAAIPLLKKETRILEYLARNGLTTILPTIFWYGMFEEMEKMCVVMSYLGEESLDRYSFPSLDSLLEWFQSAVRMLDSIHLYGVIHRDLKPGHFLFYGDKWKLIDFGFAVFVSEEEKPECKLREYIIGTPNYISISIHQGKEPGKIDDMISLGYIFLEKYRGCLPWSKPFESGEDTPFPLNHLQHPTNLYRFSLKERENFSDLPTLATYMAKYDLIV